MARDPSEFYGEDGKVPWPKLRSFIRFVLADSVRSFSGVRVHQRRTGKTLICESETETFRGAWPVSLRGAREVVVGPGTVNGRVPTILGIRIDGTDETGHPLPDGPPSLFLDDGPGDRLRSYVLLRVRIDPETGDIPETDDDAVIVTHAGEIPGGFDFVGSLDVGGYGYRPIAQLTWSADGARVVRVSPWLYFHQAHRYIPDPDGGPGRHRFEPVA